MYWIVVTANSIARASIILPITVMKSKMFQGSLKKFYTHHIIKFKFNYSSLSKMLREEKEEEEKTINETRKFICVGILMYY